jgi:hypothetical protein
MYKRKNAQKGKTGRRPGQSAREQQRTITNAAPGKTFAAQAWGKGAAGEKHVGERLNWLRQYGWTVEHDLKISPRGANVDHLVIGPPGVFVIDTKNVSGNVWVGGPNILVGGYFQDYVENLEAQALHVRERLLNVTGWGALWVQGVLVFVNPNLHVKAPPRNIAVLSADELVPELLHLPQKLAPFAMEGLAQAAKRGSTWA